MGGMLVVGSGPMPRRYAERLEAKKIKGHGRRTGRLPRDNKTSEGSIIRGVMCDCPLSFIIGFAQTDDKNLRFRAESENTSRRIAEEASLHSKGLRHRSVRDYTVSQPLNCVFDYKPGGPYTLSECGQTLHATCAS